MAPKIISRDTWGALSARKCVSMVHPIPVVYYSFLEATSTVEFEVLRSAQRLHIEEQDHDDIDCSFVIGRDGTVYEGRGWFSQAEVKKSEPAGGHYLEIGFIGQVAGMSIYDPPLAALTDLLDFAVDKEYLLEDYKNYGETHADYMQAQELCDTLQDTYGPIQET